jgi:hypothetical protein
MESNKLVSKFTRTWPRFRHLCRETPHLPGTSAPYLQSQAARPCLPQPQHWERVLHSGRGIRVQQRAPRLRWTSCHRNRAEEDRRQSNIEMWGE